MEKIYMEENKNGKKKRSVVDTSVVLSFVVAIFAVFSLAMAGLSMNQKSGVSYAAPTSDASGFTLNYDEEKYIAEDSQHNFYIFPMYYAGSVAEGNQVFCIERNREATNGSAYTKSEDEITDPGLLYLLGLGYNNRDLKKINANFEYPDDIDGWVIQSAIWKYLAEKYSTQDEYKLVNKVEQPSGQVDNDLAVMEATGTIIIKHGASDTGTAYNHLAEAISTLVANAYNASVPTIKAEAASSEYSKSDDGNSFISALINVTGNPSSSLESFDINLSGINGATIINENGQEIEKTNIAPGTKIYVKVPVDSVTEKGQTVKLDVVGHFTSGTAYKYVNSDSNLQKIALVGPVNKSTGVELVFSPDTGMNTTQTIYFIGLIVLLCGVGIVYANAKPVQVKQ